MLGAIIGDIVGSRFEFDNIKTKDFDLFDEECDITDDTVMTTAVAEMCIEGCVVNDKENIIRLFKKWGLKYPYAGYGTMFSSWIISDNPKPYNSYGNGAAMRISPIGFYAKSVMEVEQFSQAVTEVSHNHSEGIKGAYVTAMCIFLARKGKSKGEIKRFVEKYYDLNFNYDYLVKNYTHGEEICQNTVPQAIYCFLISNSFEDTIRTTISIGGDCDTTAAISGAIAEAYYGIPEDIKEKALAFIPKDIQIIINRFYSLFHDNLLDRNIINKIEYSLINTADYKQNERLFVDIVNKKNVTICYKSLIDKSSSKVFLGEKDSIELIRRINDINFLDWEDNTFENSYICDGVSWRLEIETANGISVKGGVNEFPYNWKEFLELRKWLIEMI